MSQIVRKDGYKMKVRPSVKPICEKCKMIKRKGKIMVICENPRSTSRSRADAFVNRNAGFY